MRRARRRTRLALTSVFLSSDWQCSDERIASEERRTVNKPIKQRTLCPII
uniref:Pheromone Phb3.3 B47 n=1 Tax=Coprinopsis cinerea TaxID=5346 RepID=Q6TMA9_COPCI|nr:pheromone precursor Phb3.3 B47 [Coprinopsis cinerea]